MKPKILWNAKDHPSLNSGYGIVGGHLLPLLGDHYGRENIIIYAPVYQKDSIGSWEGLKVVSGTEFSFGENMILDHYQEYNCNLLLMVGDTGPLGIVPDLPAQDKILWVQWIPVDWLGMSKNVINRISPAYKLVSFSKYGEASLRKAGLNNVAKAIWVGLDTSVWKPLPRERFPQIMSSLGFGMESFNVLLVGANQERKRIRHQLEAISLLKKVHPEIPLRLYLHTLVVGERDLRADLDELGIVELVVYPDQYIMTQGGFPEDVMVRIYNCADVVLNVCMEGFGLSQTQAQACGVPVIVLSEGAGPELASFGYEIPPIGSETSAHQQTIPIPNVVAITRCLEDSWEKRKQKGSPLRSEPAIKFIQDNFSWNKIASQWVEVIDEAMGDRERFCMQIPATAEWLDTKARTLVELS